MKQFLGVLALMIAVTGVKAVAWISSHEETPSLVPQNTGDIFGMIFVAGLVVTFVACSIWYLVKGRHSDHES